MESPVKILVVEDDHGITDLLKTVLAPDCFLVSVTPTAQQGLDLIPAQMPEVVVLVLDSPDTQSLDTCLRFRQASEAAILVLSSNGKPNFAEQVLNVGADDYLTKPITGNLIVASLNKLARRARAERNAVK